MATIVIEHWIAHGESTFAEWFKEVYLAARWNRWHINGAAFGGITPSQQGIGSHHSVIKKTCVPSARASTSGVLNGILPRILKSDGENLCPEVAAHFCEGPVPPEMIAKAVNLVATEGNYRLVRKGRGRNRRLISILFNVSKHILDGRGMLGSDVDEQRAERSLNSLEVRIPRGIKSTELQFELLSLHRVLVKSQTLPERFDLVPIWPVEHIKSVRDLLHCTFESFIRSGWVCSHILATLSILRLLDLQSAMANVPVRRTPGRPRNRQQALTVEANQDGYYDVDRLVRLFLRQPGQPLQWRVMDELSLGNDTDETSSFIGVVVALRIADGVYKWTVRFDDGRIQDYEVERLAQAVNRAHSLGARVTG